ncbi:exodeoxyribonuclease I [Chitinimonas lacunae]|uniref:Exodeoxyribonuclease I n=1 Tax=Chitinimonas lacunae TaxID=1963018 RepID=A0ABV8MVI6_9NEIS
MNSDQGASFFWHDYESFGLNPRLDRPAQFAGQRTDLDLNPIGEPVSLYCRLSDDYLPDPDACLITGIGPTTVQTRGLPEPEFVARIHAELAKPQTCGLGYNTLRFDDEMTRHLLWRNLYEPYGREFRNGCSRWDILDLVRATYAFRPEGITWPRRDDGQVSFKLEHLTAANGISHGRAHDALSDVEATIALARLIKTRQPRLFDFCLRLRQRQAVLDELAPLDGRPFLHVSGMYPASRGCMAVVAPLGWHPSNRNELAVWDLAHDPTELFDLDAEQLRRRLFARSDATNGESRLPIKTIHLNRSPVVVGSLRALFPERAAELGIDLERALIHAERLKHGPKPEAALAAAYSRQEPIVPRDVDEALYDGFIGDRDRRSLDRLRRLAPAQLADERVSFDDPRLEELLFRYRARNWPDQLDADERLRWQAHRADRLVDGAAGALSLAALRERLAALREPADSAQTALLDELERYAAHLAATLA